MTSASALIRATVSAGSSTPSKSRVTSSRPSTNTKLRTLENCELIACTRCSVKRAKDATDPEMSAMTKISGLAGSRRLEAQVDRHATGREAAANGVTQVDRAATSAASSAREANGEFATERAQRALELGHLVAIGVHDVEVFGQRLAHGLGERLGAAVFDESLTDDAFDLGLQLSRCAREPLRARGAGTAGRHHSRPSREALLQVLEIEIAQCPIEVVRAADRTTRFHPGVARDRLTGRQRAAPRGRRRATRGRAARRAPAALSELDAPPPSPRDWPGPLAPAAPSRVHLAGVDVVHHLRRGVPRARREEDLEGRVEDGQVVAVFHQRRGERVLHQGRGPTRSITSIALAASTCSLIEIGDARGA